MLTIVRIVLIIVFIGLGFLGFQFFAAMKKPPAETGANERPLPVKGMRLERGNIPVTLEGYGTVRARTRVAVSPEVGGLIVDIHPRLEAGEVIPEGEVLFRVDPRTYTLRLNQANAEIVRLNSEIARIRQQQANDARRLELSQRSRDLAKSEYERVLQLLEKDEVGSRSGVEQAERVLTQAEDQVVALENAIALYPLQLEEVAAALETAEVARDTAALDLERTEVKAPFSARLEQVSLERDQVVMAGREVLTIVDDSVLEIPVSLDSSEMSLWFPFEEPGEAGNTNGWFRSLPRDVDVKVAWTEHPETHRWTGALARVERFSAETSTAIVVVEVVAPDGGAGPAPVEGMFCEVAIPGRTARDVFRVPADAVTHEGAVYLSVKERLRTLPVEIVHRTGAEVLVRGELNDGDILVTTRIAAPLENMLLKVALPGADAE
jgi:multidrug efflux pump subunit AcrA (membrane-fusion protein)